MILDLQFQNCRGVIATAVIRTEEGLALVDPGPASCLATLETGLASRGASLSEVRWLLLTHIHLDHAGAAGTIRSRVPACRVFVHERGAPHLVDPSKLMASAARLYGADMDRLWGEVRPLAADAVQIVRDEDEVEIGRRRLRVRETPGHASHHVSYFDLHEGLAYVGDTAGIHTSGHYVIAPTPPPDIDIELWQQSLNRIADLEPDRLLLTHFGIVEEASSHIVRFRQVLTASAARVRETLAMPGDDGEKIQRFTDAMRADARRVLSEEDAAAVELAAPFGQLWLGLARYWRKREA